MKRTTVMLPDDLDKRVRLEARRRGISIAEVAREAIDGFVPHLAHELPGFFTVGAGGPPDASERVDILVSEAISRRHRVAR